MNIAEIILKLQDVAEATFNQAAFPFELIEAYAPPKATLAKLRQGTLNKATQGGDLLWAKKFHFRPASPGTAGETLDCLSAEWSGKRNIPRLLFSTDGSEIAAFDTKLEDPLNISFHNLADRYDFFLPLGGGERYQGPADAIADIKHLYNWQSSMTPSSKQIQTGPNIVEFMS